MSWFVIVLPFMFALLNFQTTCHLKPTLQYKEEFKNNKANKPDRQNAGRSCNQTTPLLKV